MDDPSATVIAGSCGPRRGLWGRRSRPNRCWRCVAVKRTRLCCDVMRSTACCVLQKWVLLSRGVQISTKRWEKGCASFERRACVAPCARAAGSRDTGRRLPWALGRSQQQRPALTISTKGTTSLSGRGLVPADHSSECEVRCSSQATARCGVDDDRRPRRPRLDDGARRRALPQLGAGRRRAPPAPVAAAAAGSSRDRRRPPHVHTYTSTAGWL